MNELLSILIERWRSLAMYGEDYYGLGACDARKECAEELEEALDQIENINSRVVDFGADPYPPA